MKTVHLLSGVACMSLLLATGALAEIQGVQPGTSANPKDNVPKEIQREGGDFGSGGSGPGRRSDELVGTKKEKPESVTQQGLEANVEKTQGGGAAVAAEGLKEKSSEKSKKGASEPRAHQGMKKKPQAGSGAQAGASDAVNGEPKKAPK